MTGRVFNIQRFSIHDGPGIRTTVFLQGCNLQCFWCHNPESLAYEPRIQYFSQKCIGCGSCVTQCPVGAHQLSQGEHHFVRGMCQACGKCVDSCYAQALVLTSKEMSVASVIEEVMKDEPFYVNSQGGVTFSGGESMLQYPFLKALIEASRSRGLHIAVDTAGDVPWIRFEELLPLVDVFLYDLKHMDEQTHKAVTGVSNKQILVNLATLTQHHANVWVRIPIIPGVNDTSADMEKMAQFLRRIAPVALIELMPFHRLGEGKYTSLGLPYQASSLQAPSQQVLAGLAGIFEQAGLPIKMD